MQLSYRGKQYTHDAAPVDMVDSGLVGVYRGQTVHFSYPRHLPGPQPTHRLMYRGVAYQTGTADVRSVEQPAAVAPVAAPSCLRVPTRPHRTSEYDKVHQLNIQRRLQHRIEVAKARGDQQLLNLLQHELQQAG